MIQAQVIYIALALGVMLYSLPLTRAQPMAEICARRPCPQFELLETNEDYEKRNYAESNWVVTSASFLDKQEWETVKLELNSHLLHFMKFNRLRYTVPRIRRITSSGNSAGHNTLSMAFYLNQAPDEPNHLHDMELRESLQPMVIYARVFTGLVSYDKWDAEIETLRESLNANNIGTDDGVFVRCEYGDYRNPNSRKEVWYVDSGVFL